MTVKAYVLVLAILLFLLNVADYLTTMWALSLGGMEINPIANMFIHTLWAPFIKIGVVGFVSFFLYRHIRSRVGVIALTVVVALYVLVVAWNSLNLVLYYAIA